VADVAVHDSLLFAEYVHLRYSSLWHPKLGGEPFSWAYQTVAGVLWDETPVLIDSDRLVAMVVAAAERQFGERGISFSTSSVLGILHWLRALRPRCVLASRFYRRTACPPEALLLALEAIHASRRHSLDLPIHLDKATRLLACRMVLIDEEAFEETLAQAEDAFGLIRRCSDGVDVVLMRSSLCPGLVA